MRVLWLCNLPIRPIAEKEKLEESPYGGWIEGLYNNVYGDNDIAIGMCFPYDKRKIRGIINGVEYFSFHRPNLKLSDINRAKDEFKEILELFKPDIVHIFGTEYVHTYAMLKAFDTPEKSIIQIQGLVSVCEKYYMCGLPTWVRYGMGLKEIYYRTNLYIEKRRFIRQGYYEKESIGYAQNVLGRTDWDEACVKQMNANVSYYRCNEILRESFYADKWDVDSCARRTIFVSQCNYPIKGFHYMLEALVLIKKVYNDVRVITTGENFMGKKAYKRNMYQKYLCKLIKKYNLYENIEFVGQLDEKEIKERYLKCNVFVSPSTIENSSNSVCEAMILGVPVVSSYVGGISSLLEHQKEGYLYQGSSPYMLAYYVLRIFEDDEIAKKMSEAAWRRAIKTHDHETNVNILKKVYEEIQNK